MTILSGLLCLGTWLLTSSVPVLIAFVTGYGVCSGVFIAVLPVIVARITPDEKLGGRVGAFYSVCAIAQLVGSPIGGALIKPSGGSEEGNGWKDGDNRFVKLIEFAVGIFVQLGLS